MAATTTADTVHAKILAVLAAAEASLRVDARQVRLWNRLPEKDFRQTELPIVVMEDPLEQSREDWTTDDWRIEYRLQFWFVDVAKPSEAEIRVTTLRLRALRDLVKAALDGTPNLGMAWLGVMPGMTTWSASATAEGDPFGNNLLRIGATLDVPVIVGKGA